MVSGPWLVGRGWVIRLIGPIRLISLIIPIYRIRSLQRRYTPNPELEHLFLTGVPHSPSLTSTMNCHCLNSCTAHSVATSDVIAGARRPLLAGEFRPSVGTTELSPAIDREEVK